MPRSKRSLPYENVFSIVTIVTSSLLPVALLATAWGTNLPDHTWVVLGMIQLRTLNLSAGIRSTDPVLLALINRVLDCSWKRI